MSVENRADTLFRRLQDEICEALERLEAGVRFREDLWQRPGGGGGRSRVLEGGAVFEKAGVNTSTVHGRFPPDFAAQLPGDGLEFTACGISLVLHPRNPHVPAVHANFRCLRRGSALWFGGGSDLTPYYPVLDDVVHFHSTWKVVCDRHDAAFYPRFKRACDEYFYLPHRKETRGVGGIFFDHLMRAPETDLAFVTSASRACTRSSSWSRTRTCRSSPSCPWARGCPHDSWRCRRSRCIRPRRRDRGSRRS